MSTLYIPTRDSKIITRAEFIKTFGAAMYLDDEDKANGVTFDVATSIGVDTGGGYIWCYFYNDVLTGTEDFGVGNDGGHSVICARLGINLIDEHDDDFSYHQFPKDVDVDAPDYKSPNDEWEVYMDDGWFYAFERKERMFIMGTVKKADEFGGDFEAFLEVIRQEYN